MVYLQSVGSVDVRSFATTSPALLWSSYLRQRQGTAIANVLLGKVNPSGHLPFTWYAGDDQLPSIADYGIRPTPTTPGRTYMYFTGTPTFAFGHGLTYSGFSYSRLKVARSSVAATGTIEATAVVTNTGDVKGAATPQLYVSTPFAPASAERPGKRLAAFDRVELRPGRSKKVSFSVPVSSLAFLDEATETMQVDRGTYGLQLASSSAQVASRASVRITGELGRIPTTVSVRPVQAGDQAADVAQRVAFDAGTTIDPQVTLATDDEALSGYVSKGRSTPLPDGARVRYSSNRRDVVAVEQGGTVLRTAGSGIATVTVSATYHATTVTTSFVVNVAPLQITSGPTATFTAAAAGSFTVTTATTQSPTPQEIPGLSVLGALPNGLSFVDNHNGTGTLAGTPTSPGTATVRVGATNEVSAPVTQVLTVAVS